MPRSGGPLLKATQKYPRGFGRTVVRYHMATRDTGHCLQQSAVTVDMYLPDFAHPALCLEAISGVPSCRLGFGFASN